MRTFSLLKGMSVFHPNNEKIGEVCDLCISDEGNVTDLLIQDNGILRKKYRLPIEHISSFDEDGIRLKEVKLSKYHKLENEHTMQHVGALLKKTTFSQYGEELGLLDDVYFSEKVGTIIGYELTDGFFSDITNGKRVIRTPYPPKIEGDAIIVSVNKLRGGNTHDEMSELPE